MAKEEAIQVKNGPGDLPGDVQVALENGHKVLAHVSGKF